MFKYILRIIKKLIIYPIKTTVKIELGGNLLSSVKFGAVNYKTDETIHFDIAGDGIILFDALSKRNVSLGSVEIL